MTLQFAKDIQRLFCTKETNCEYEPMVTFVLALGPSEMLQLLQEVEHWQNACEVAVGVPPTSLIHPPSATPHPFRVSSAFASSEHAGQDGECAGADPG